MTPASLVGGAAPWRVELLPGSHDGSRELASLGG